MSRALMRAIRLRFTMSSCIQFWCLHGTFARCIGQLMVVFMTIGH